MKYLIALAIFMSGLFGAASAQDEGKRLVVIGAKQDVLNLISKTMREVAPDSVFTDTGGRPGVAINYKTFFKGNSTVGIFLIPLAEGTSNDISGYGLDIRGGSQRGNLQEDFKNFSKEIERAINSSGLVKLAPDYSAFKSLFERSNDCFSELRGDATLSSLYKKIPSKPGDLSLIMLADDTKATDSERRELAEYSSKRAKCSSARKLAISFWPPDPRELLLIKYENMYDSLLLSLYQGEITFGTFNQRKKDISALSEKEFAGSTIDSNRDKALLDSQRAENERRLELERLRIAAEFAKAEAIRNQNTQIKVSPSRCRTTTMGSTINTECE